MFTSILRYTPEKRKQTPQPPMEPGARPLLDYHPGSARYALPQDPPSLTTKVGARLRCWWVVKILRRQGAMIQPRPKGTKSAIYFLGGRASR